MSISKPFLCLDFGSGSLKLAEFAVDASGALCLRRLGVQDFGPGGGQEAAREEALVRALESLQAGKRGPRRRAQACASGLQVFTKFLKLPPVDGTKAAQVMQFEARQHLPFAPQEAVWDYQIVGKNAAGELDVALAAIRRDHAETLFRAADRAAVELDLLDAAPTALVNAFRYNYGELQGASLLLDIGARTSQVLLIEGDRVFWRTLNLGGNTITEALAAEAGMPWAQAEKFKRVNGFVGPGGATEEPEDVRHAALAKIARQAMTRLHLQVSQTVQFFRQHEGGAPPVRLFLAGGGSALPLTAEFFGEKLGLPVEYFNPFRRVSIGPELDRDALGRTAMALGGVVGLALRWANRCPLELDLTPAGVRQRRQLDRKIPWLTAAFAGLVLGLFAAGWWFADATTRKRALFAQRQPTLQYLQGKSKLLDLAVAKRDRSRWEASQVCQWMSSRFYWPDLLMDLRRVLLATEADTSRPGMRANVWIEKLAADVPEVQEMDEEPTPVFMGPPPWGRYVPKELAQILADVQRRTPRPSPGAGTASGSAAGPTNEIATLRLTCRAVSWSRFVPAADSELAFVFLKWLRASPYARVGTNGTELVGPMERDPATGTFAFEARLVLNQPIKY